MALPAPSGIKLPPFSLPPLHHLGANPSGGSLYGASAFPRRRCAAVVRCARRTGKRRYPSEKKRLDRRHKEQLRQTAPEEGGLAREAGFWRLSKLAVPVSDDPGKDFVGVSPPLLQAIAKALKFPVRQRIAFSDLEA